MGDRLPLLRLQAARAIAWALLLGGWVGLGSLAQALAASPASAFAMLALWLLSLGAFATLIGQVTLPPAVLRALLVVSAALLARAAPAALHGGGLMAVLPAVLGAALLVALASAAVRACRQALRVRAGPPVASAAVGALLAWLCLGDLTDVHGLVLRLATGAVIACAALALLLPRRSGVAGACRAGLFDCSMPAWSAAEWRVPAARPAMVAQLAMLPMMCGLPWMVSLCRSEAVPPQVVVGVHLAAMFMPALLALRWPTLQRHLPASSALLLALGALALLALPGGSAWWALAAAHGSAWSLAWAERLQNRTARRHGAASAFGGAALNGALVLCLGAAMAFGGLQTLAIWHLALGIAGALVAFGSWSLRAAPA